MAQLAAAHGRARAAWMRIPLLLPSPLVLEIFPLATNSGTTVETAGATAITAVGRRGSRSVSRVTHARTCVHTHIQKASSLPMALAKPEQQLDCSLFSDPPEPDPDDGRSAHRDPSPQLLEPEP